MYVMSDDSHLISMTRESAVPIGIPLGTGIIVQHYFKLKGMF